MDTCKRARRRIDERAWRTTRAGGMMRRRARRLTTRVDARERRFLHAMYGTSVLCCWFMWAVIYIAQMHPLVRPVMNRAE